MPINTFQVQNYKAFKNAEFNFHPKLNILIGENGAGKSSILEALYLLINECVYQVKSKPFRNKEELQLWIRYGQEKADFNFDSPEGSGNYFINKNGIIKENSCFWVNNYHESINISKVPVVLYVYYPATRLTNRENISTKINNKNKSSFELISKKSLLQPVTDLIFADFLLWFRLREDIENENRRDNNFYIDAELENVKRAVKVFLDAEDMRVFRNPDQLCVKRGEVWFDIKQLSDGERGLICLIGDIARRLAIANPFNENSNFAHGVILIDEIELHLHPKWQRSVIPNLLSTFPNCQFIITTHSPQVLGEVKDCKMVWILDKENPPYHPQRLYGLDSNEILTEVMGADERPIYIDNKLDEIETLINEENYEQAREKIENLAKETKDIPALLGMNALLTMSGEQQANLGE